MPSQPTTAAPPAPTQNYTGYAQTAAPRPQMPPAATQPQVPPAVTQPPQSQMPSQGYPQQQVGFNGYFYTDFDFYETLDKLCLRNCYV